MNRIEEFSSTYIQAPWRRQLQFIGLFSLALVIIAMVAGIYLNVSARASTIGREIQYMQNRIENSDREIEDLQSQLAQILSAEEMENRAQKLGFENVATEEILYLVVNGFIERQTAVLAPQSGSRNIPSAPVIPPEYTESIFDWLRRKALNFPNLLVEVKP